jgi:hypothetical protein
MSKNTKNHLNGQEMDDSDDSISPSPLEIKYLKLKK